MSNLQPLLRVLGDVFVIVWKACGLIKELSLKIFITRVFFHGNCLRVDVLKGFSKSSAKSNRRSLI